MSAMQMMSLPVSQIKQESSEASQSTPSTNERQISLQSLVQQFHFYLRDFQQQSSILLKQLPKVCNFNEETAGKLLRFLEVSETVLKRYDSLSNDERMRLFFEQKEWLSIVEDLKRMQLNSDPAFASRVIENSSNNNNAINANLYAEFLAAMKIKAFNQQRQNLIQKLKSKQILAKRSNVRRHHRLVALPPVPEFEANTCKVKCEEQEAIEPEEIFTRIQVKCEVEDNLSCGSDSVSTAVTTGTLEGSPKRASYKLLNALNQNKNSINNDLRSNAFLATTTCFRVISSVSGQVVSSNKPSSQSSSEASISGSEQSAVESSLFMPQRQPDVVAPMSGKFLEKVVSKVEEELLKLMDRLELSSDASSAIFKCAMNMIAFLTHTKCFFKNKSFTLIAASILLQASACVGYPVTMMAIIGLLQEKERCLTKIHSKLLIELREFKEKFMPVPIEALIKKIAASLHVDDAQTLAASQYLYNNMSVKGFINGARVDYLASAIVFLAATLNGAPVDVNSMQQVLGFNIEALSPTIASILIQKKSLINNPALFSNQNMLID